MSPAITVKQAAKKKAHPATQTLRPSSHASSKNLLLVSPATPGTFWSFAHVMSLISRKAAYPPLGLLTVAAMFPREWKLKVVDLNVSRLSDADIATADYVLISAMIVHAESVREIVRRCRQHGKPVIGGGPLFTTGGEKFPEVEHVVAGEAEDVVPVLIEDMRSGKVKPSYAAPERPVLSSTPLPRWDLIRLRDYATMAVQFSRGCPFNCEFCDIIEMYGRVPRIKDPGQMIRELDALLDAGWNNDIFIVDDNFIGHPRMAKALLREIISWRERRRVKSGFLTEASLNLVDIPDMLDLMVKAGIRRVFIGIESPQPESLMECNKVQNTRRDMMQSVRKIQNAGIEVMGGFIVGFDNDGPDVFERQWRFIQESGIATAMVGMLTALPQTQLYTRLKREGRLLVESTGNNVDAILNFVPRLDRDLLIDGYRRLVKQLYTPEAFYRRARTFLHNYRPLGRHRGVAYDDLKAFLKSLWIMGCRHSGRRAYFKFLTQSLLFHPRSFPDAVRLAILGFHFRRVAAEV
ncbi:MAG: B12-binding domain-containing radical SAM protein [Planctomycetota bacterium]|jgi:radical SAM superfamily enzyme YgiQ (UPF0313 family)